MTERLKRNQYHRIFVNRYFWRTKQQQEIDYVEEKDGGISGFEFKWNPKAKVNLPPAFIKTYEAEATVVTNESFRDFVGA